jgi:YVTN family beta-propeller protein
MPAAALTRDRSVRVNPSNLLEMPMFARFTVGVCVLVCVGVTSSLAAEPKSPSAGYHVLKKYEVKGPGRWDYLTVDAKDRRLYVSRETRVIVLDPDSGKVLGEIPDTAGVHGIALAPDMGRGFTSNGKANSATIFDLKTLKELGSVKTGTNPDAILFDPFTKRVFTFNGRSNDATVFDAATGKVLGTIPLGGKPEFAVSDGSGHVYVNIEDKSEVVRLDPKELKVTARWPLGPGEEPSGLAIDIKNHRLFSACGNKLMMVLDAESGKVLAKLPIGERVDGAAFDPSTGNAFSSNGDGTLTVVHEDSPGKFSVAETVTTLPGARTIALDSKTHHLFLPTARFEAAAPGGTGRQRPAMVPDSFVIVVVGR